MTRQELTNWLKESDPAKLKLLYRAAETVRLQTLRNAVCVHGIIEFSNHCSGSGIAGEKGGGGGCLYCGLQERNLSLNRYRLTAEEIVSLATEAANEQGYKMLVLQSGTDPYYTTEMLAEIIRQIRQCARVLIFLSIGERSKKDYRALHQAGARGMLFRFETSDSRLYAALHPNGKLERRLEHLRWMKEVGFLIASGPLVDIPSPCPDKIPDQTTDSLADDIVLMKELGVKMASIGPYVKADGALLAKLRPEKEGLSFNLAVKMIALTRLVMPNVRIPCTTALEVSGLKNGLEIGEIRRLALRAGATAFMLSLAPDKARKNYCLYRGKEAIWHGGSRHSLEDLFCLIQEEGKTLCPGWGKKDDLTDQEFQEGICVVNH